MTWTKLSDDFSDDCWTLSDVAFRLHTEALVWSNRKLLNLRISRAEVRRFATHPEAAEELLEVGMWEAEGEDYLIVHHGAYQRDREAVIKQQRANIENGRRGGKAAGVPREIKSKSPIVFDNPSESVSDSPSERDRPVRAGITTQPSLNKESVSLSKPLSNSLPKSGGLSDTLEHCKVCRKKLGWPMARNLAFCDSTDAAHKAAKGQVAA